jgi:hypothetical protein
MNYNYYNKSNNNYNKTNNILMQHSSSSKSTLVLPTSSTNKVFYTASFVDDNGHSFNYEVNGKSYHKNYHDKRLSNNTYGYRSNIRDRQNKPLPLNKNKQINGYSYTDHLVCTSCKQPYKKKQFENNSICKSKKSHVGFNIKCRKCNDKLNPNNSHVKEGYNKNDFICETKELTTNDYYDTTNYIGDCESNIELNDSDIESSDCESESDIESSDCESESDIESSDCESESDIELSDCENESDIELSENVYEVDYIVKTCIKQSQIFYLVKWTGYSHKHNTWEPEESFDIKYK